MGPVFLFVFSLENAMQIKLGRFTQLLNGQTPHAVPYNAVLLAVLSGHVPGEMIGGRWFVDDAAIPAAVAHFAKQRNRRSAPVAAA